MELNSQPLFPFGLEVSAAKQGAALDDLSGAMVHGWLAEHRVVALRGFGVTDDPSLLSFCRRLGPLLEWQFGAINELRVRPEQGNYLYTESEVPFHWDGAFVGQVPQLIFFHCVAAPPSDCGGQTLFCDTTRLLAELEPAERTRLEPLSITYCTEKVVHYGGTFTSPVICPHPRTRKPVIRFAEPVRDLNPVQLKIKGLPAGDVEPFLQRMHDLLRDPRFSYTHTWRDGDILLADNDILLHARTAFTQSAPRHLRRVNILGTG